MGTIANTVVYFGYAPVILAWHNFHWDYLDGDTLLQTADYCRPLNRPDIPFSGVYKERARVLANQGRSLEAGNYRRQAMSEHSRDMFYTPYDCSDMHCRSAFNRPIIKFGLLNH